MKNIELKVEGAIEFIKDKLFCPKISLIYDHVVVGHEAEFPTKAEADAVYPNPCGYTTGMEDSILGGGTMLDAALLRYEIEGDASSGEFAKKLVRGMLGCAFSAKTEGFLPRSVCIEDGFSHYPDSSRDQYTLFAFSMHRYLNSELCSPDEREQITRAAVGIARRCERNVIPENGYDLLTDEGGRTLNNVMWGDTLGNHEYLRLPMLYLFAYEASGDRHWLEKYRQIREEAYKKSLPMTEYWAMYTLGQMQASVRLCYDVDTDEGWRERFFELMNTVADYAEGECDRVWRAIEKKSNYNAPQIPFRDIKGYPAECFIRLGYPDAVTLDREDGIEYFTLQDAAQLAITVGLAPQRKASENVKKLLADGFEKIDFTKHERNLPLYFVSGYYRSIK